MKLSLDLSKIWKRFLILLFAASFIFFILVLIEAVIDQNMHAIAPLFAGILAILCFPTWIHWVAKEIALGWKEGMKQEDNNEE